MLSKLFRSRAQPAPRALPAVPDATVVWAVGDIHGRLDLLEPLVEAIVADMEASTAERQMVVFLGDYIDRGPDSRGVIRFLHNLSAGPGVEFRFLKGNHEQAMLDFLNDPSAGARWCEYGGDRALTSYGLRVPELTHRTEAWARVAADLRHKLSKGELAFLESLEFSVSVGDYFFAHAGARPGVALARQSPQDLMWIRNSFLDSRIGFEKVIVHGHTPTLQVHADQRRIGIDTKAYDTGVLTALRLEGRQRSLLQATGSRRVSKPEHGAEDSLHGGTTVLARTELLEDPIGDTDGHR
jgi:serine/threonine protein phosphatase 1